MGINIDTGVFIPIGRHGWVHSVNAPEAETGTYERLLKVVRGAEALGFDFVLSPALWRGLKGPSRHWMDSLESITASAALLQATERIKVFATLHVTVFPPAVIAKQAYTLDQIGPGRVGLNLVTGGSVLDLAQAGLWDDSLDHDRRYDMASEWTKVVKRLWNEDIVTHKGEFFETMDATGTRPSISPTLVNAGASPRGLRFAAEDCDIAFIPASNVEVARRARQFAREANNPNFKLYGLTTFVAGETDAEAQARMDYFNAGVDIEALDDIAAGYEQNRSKALLGPGTLGRAGGVERKPIAIPQGALVGSYENLARRVATMVLEAELDGILVRVPDFVVDLKAIATRTLPLMAEYGVTCNIGRP